jgi:hypothetical protein
MTIEKPFFGLVKRSRSRAHCHCSYAFHGVCSGDSSAEFESTSPPAFNMFSEVPRQPMTRTLCEKHARKFAQKHWIDWPLVDAP